MRIFQLSYTTLLSILLLGCSSTKSVSNTNAEKNIKPVQFFIGKTQSTGVIENRVGKPTTNITTETIGVFKDSILHVEQDLFPEGGKKNHRSWQITLLNDTVVEATANDIDGKAVGTLKGNHFSWTFRLKLSNRKFIKHARMTQYYYLMPDGKTMIIRSIIRKFSFTVAQITEQFQKN